MNTFHPFGVEKLLLEVNSKSLNHELWCIMEQITKHVEGQFNGQRTRPPHGDLQVATTTDRRALRSPIALDRLLPIRRQRIRLDAHYLSRFVVQTLGATTAMLPLPRRSSPKATMTSRACAVLWIHLSS